MGLIYVIENFINDECRLYGKSEDPLYVLENIYNERPSLPYRTTGIGTLGDPEYICVDLGTYSGVEHTVTFIGIFNHNLTTLGVPNDLLILKSCDADDIGGCITYESGGCDWDYPECEINLKTLPPDPCDGCVGTQPVENFPNLWHKIDCPPARNWRLDMIDQGNTNRYLEIGELVLGQWQQFSRGPLTGAGKPWVRLSPGRADGPAFFMGKQRTHYGQDWSTFYSECERFELKLTSQNDPCLVDEVHAFLSAVQLTGGRFVLVPDDTKPFCYYVIIENLRDYADRLIYGRTRELREWRLDLKTLTHGVRLL